MVETAHPQFFDVEEVYLSHSQVQHLTPLGLSKTCEESRGGYFFKAQRTGRGLGLIECPNFLQTLNVEKSTLLGGFQRSGSSRVSVVFRHAVTNYNRDSVGTQPKQRLKL